MKAIVWEKYGPAEGLVLKEAAKPAPDDDEILVKIRSASVTAGDCEMRRLQLPLMLSLPVRIYAGLVRPKRIRILGQEFSGDIESVGKNVRMFKVGDAVYGTTGFGFGGYAEYKTIKETPGDAEGVISKKPEPLSYAEAAVLPTAGFEALHYLRSAKIGKGDNVLIIGAGGSIGTTALQIAKSLGVTVTAVDGTKKSNLLRTLGADRVIDYTKEDYLNSDERFDLIIDVVGRRQVAKRLKLLAKDGFYFLAYAGLRHIFLAWWTSLTSKKHFKIESANQRNEDLAYLEELVNNGAFRPVMGKSFPLEEMAEAHRYAESGEKLGNIAIIVRD